jgi:hypothetical protein
MTSAPEFGYGTEGVEVVKTFPDRVKGRTCMYSVFLPLPELTSCKS